MYVYSTVATVYAFAKFMYTVRYLKYMFLLNECILYGSCGICCCEMCVYCTVAAVYVVKCMYTVR